MSLEGTARRPLIGLSIGGDQRHPAYLRMRRTYPRAIEQAGGLPLLLPPMEDAEALREAVQLLDGMVFPGGPDVAPAHYGVGEVHPTTCVDDALDGLELALAAWATSSELPTLGICRGQQLLNVALGGTLIQDLPSHQPESEVVHAQPASRSALTHDLTLDPTSRLADVLGVQQCRVNSFHHQAVDRLGRGLRPVAWSPDGVVEGVESDEHPWLLAVQFHPEELVGFHQPSQRLFRALVDACRDRSRRQPASAPGSCSVPAGRAITSATAP